MVTFLGIAIRVSAGLVRETKWHEPRLDMPNTVRGGSRSRNGVTLIEMGVVVAIVLVLLALLVASVQSMRAESGRMQSLNNIRQIIREDEGWGRQHQ